MPIDHAYIELQGWLSQLGIEQTKFQYGLSDKTLSEANEHLSRMREMLGEVERLVPLVQWKEQ